MRGKSQLKDMHRDLSSILGAQRLQQLSGLTRLRRLWPDIVGSMLAARTEPIELKPGEGDSYVLVIAVTHSTIAQEVHFLRDDIRRACFEKARMGRISKMYTQVQVGAGFRQERQIMPTRSISLTQKKQLARELQTIKDIALRRAMFYAHVAQLQYSLEESQ